MSLSAVTLSARSRGFSLGSASRGAGAATRSELGLAPGAGAIPPEAGAFGEPVSLATAPSHARTKLPKLRPMLDRRRAALSASAASAGLAGSAWGTTPAIVPVLAQRRPGGASRPGPVAPGALKRRSDPGPGTTLIVVWLPRRVFFRPAAPPPPPLSPCSGLIFSCISQGRAGRKATRDPTHTRVTRLGE